MADEVLPVEVSRAEGAGFRRKLEGGDAKALAEVLLGRDSGDTYCGNGCDIAPRCSGIQALLGKTWVGAFRG